MISKKVRQLGLCERCEVFRTFYSASDHDAIADHRHYRLRNPGLHAAARERPAAVNYLVVQDGVTYPGARMETVAKGCALVWRSSQEFVQNQR